MGSEWWLGVLGAFWFVLKIFIWAFALHHTCQKVCVGQKFSGISQEILR
jgi:hypothetical protein